MPRFVVGRCVNPNCAYAGVEHKFTGQMIPKNHLCGRCFNEVRMEVINEPEA